MFELSIKCSNKCSRSCLYHMFQKWLEKRQYWKYRTCLFSEATKIFEWSIKINLGCPRRSMLQSFSGNDVQWLHGFIHVRRIPPYSKSQKETIICARFWTLNSHHISNIEQKWNLKVMRQVIMQFGDLTRYASSQLSTKWRRKVRPRINQGKHASGTIYFGTVVLFNW